MRTLIVIAGLLVIVVAGVLMTAAYRWNSRTTAEIAKLDRLSTATNVAKFELAQLDGLPAPVARYFRAVLRDGLPFIRRARLMQ